MFCNEITRSDLVVILDGWKHVLGVAKVLTSHYEYNRKLRGKFFDHVRAVKWLQEYDFDECPRLLYPLVGFNHTLFKVKPGTKRWKILLHEYPIDPVLMKIGATLRSRQPLTFETLEKLSKLSEYTNDRYTLDEISHLLTRHINLTREISGIDFFKDFLRLEDDETLGTQIDYAIPRDTIPKDEINLKLKASLLGQYRLLHRRIGKQFIQGRITHVEYIKRTEENAEIAHKLWPKRD